MTYDSETYLFKLANLLHDSVGEEFDGTDEPEPELEPVRHITTLAGQRVPIDPYGAISWDAP